MKKNIVLFIVVLILSYFTASYFGSWYDNFSPQSDDSWFNLGKQELIFMVGLPFAYIFFTTLLFQTLASGNKTKWTIWLLVPAFFFFLSGDIQHIYLPVALAIIACVLAKLLNLLISKFKRPNTPMVIR